MPSPFAQKLCVDKIDHHATIISLLDDLDSYAVVCTLADVLDMLVHGKRLAADCFPNYTRYQCVVRNVFGSERHAQLSIVRVACNFFNAQLHNQVFR